MHTCLTIFILFAVVLSGCESDPPSGALTVRDSAGVRISISQGGAQTFAEVDPQPVVTLGGAHATGPTQFSNIRGIYVDPEGNIWVADGSSKELRIFRPDGSHWNTVGGEGGGPGEFERIRLLGAFGGDSVALWDDANQRLTILDPDGGLVRTVTASSGDEKASLHAVEVFPDGDLLAEEVRTLFAGSVQPGEVIRDTTRLVRADLAAGTRKALARVPENKWIWKGGRRIPQVPVPFTINHPVALHGEEIYLATGPDFRIRVFEDGELTEIYGVAREPREVTGEVKETYREFYGQVISDSTFQNAYLSALDHPSVPELLPAYSRILVAASGNVWAQVYAPDLFAAATWDVYSPDREWLGRVQTPVRLRVHAIADGKLVGVWRDELGVEYIRVYQLIGQHRF